ncbi:MAG: malto-oligosyltrehalose trehalohydrolase [Flaviaesturariibacter sp.]|nr:malto-oligosyltrehalose trehalohydrolase [Flaviaesturariibacter sp.]
MMESELLKRTVGVNFSDGATEVNVWAPMATTVELLLSETDQKLALKKADMGYWSLTTTQVKPGHLYQFIVNDGSPLPDPASLSQPKGVHGPSKAIDLKAFAEKETAWRNHPLEDYILYELHTGTLTADGDFAGIEAKLDHLVSLGVNAIEIMPVAQFPGNRNWGYDGVFPFAVQDSYGGPEGLAQLVNACHQKGIAVVLDVVYNHMGPEGNYLGAYGPYFTDKYKTPWGNAINFDDAWCDGVRQYFIENALMWFRDFEIDALRLDAVHAIKDFSPVHILADIKKAVDALMAQTGRTHYLIVELDLNDNRFINPQERGGYGMDAQWIDEFHHALRVTATGERTGYYSDFNGLQHLVKAYRDAYVYDGQYSPHRNKMFGVKAEENTGQQFIVFSQNHDQVGNRMLGERSSQLVSFEMQKLLAGAVLVSPYLPMLFMGEEWSEPNPFLYFVSHTDAELADAVRKGRKAEFAAFHAEGEAPDPMAEETFQSSKLQWNLIEGGRHETMLEFYKALIALRKTHPVLKRLSRADLEVAADEASQTIILQRWNGEERIACFQNFSDAVQSVSFPEEADGFTLVFDSAAPGWGGPKAAIEKLSANEPLVIQPQSFLIYSNTHV